MDDLQRINLSYYKTIATINYDHKIYLVQNINTQKIFVKKILDVYNMDIYVYLFKNPILGTPKIIELYEENNQLFIIEDYVSGESLQELLDSNKLSEKSIIKYICELCEILKSFHSLNPPIVHRDIKPSNIMITSFDHVVLIDFNAAKYLTNIDSSDTILLGTKGYAAPEQYGFGSSTPQTDVYAIGVLFKELISSVNIPSTLYMKVISKCTQINPADRYKSVNDLKLELMKLSKPLTQSSGSISPLSWKSFLPPGYRTLKPWKMFISSIVYLFISWLSFSLNVENTFGIALWVERFFCFFVMLSVILISFNYCNIQQHLPLCKSKYRLVHYFGILLWSFITVLSLFIILTILVSILLL